MPYKTNPSEIRNKQKRSEVYRQVKSEKKKAQKEERKRRVREVEELGEDAPPPRKQRTQDNTRDPDCTIVGPGDTEVLGDEAEDEFARIFDNEQKPKIMITTRPRPSSHLFPFISDLMNIIPNSFFYPRKTFTVPQICEWATKKDFTHVFVLSEKRKSCNGVIVSALPRGPTAFFKVTNIMTSTDVPGRGKALGRGTQPELILNNFSTRLGRRVGRFLGSWFPHEPQFKARQVVTFHNQRDFVFVRHHRYMFAPGKSKEGKEDTGARARLQELGPRFTLKMRWLQEGTFDTEFGEYEWLHKRREMDTTRRTFHL